MTAAIINVESNKRNYILISEECNGRVWIDTFTVNDTDTMPDEINGAEVCYYDQIQIDLLKVGDSCQLDGSNAIVVRVY